MNLPFPAPVFKRKSEKIVVQSETVPTVQEIEDAFVKIKKACPIEADLPRVPVLKQSVRFLPF